MILGGNHISNSVVDYKNFIIHPGDKSPVIKDLEDPNIDFAIIGESDFTFATFVDKIINNQDYSSIPGLVKKLPNGSYKINQFLELKTLLLYQFPQEIWLIWRDISILVHFILLNQNLTGC